MTRTTVRRLDLAVTAVAAVVFAAAAPPLDAQASEKLVRGWPLDRDGQVKIFSPAGRIRVVGWDRDSIAVSGTIARGAPFYGGGSRRGVKFGIEGLGGPGAASGDFTVYVPATAIVWVRGAATDISVEGLTGGVDVGCVSGAVQVLGDPRELLAEAMEGTVDIVGSPGFLRAKTASGALSWRGHAQDATLGSVSGRIEALGGPAGRVRIETISGDVSVDAALARDADVVIESHSGNVELRLPSGTPTALTVDAARVVGEPRGAPTAATGKRPPPRTIPLNGGAAGATATVTVRSFKGELRLLPARAQPK